MRAYTVLEACNGEEALRTMEQTNPYILLLDIGLAVLDGDSGYPDAELGRAALPGLPPALRCMLRLICPQTLSV
jgi:CheY-like chemotaxis protein